jgi:DNA replication and repair protein RecF
MQLTKVEITNFRNLSSISILPSDGINILYGENGSGKTSFLEAIYYLFMGRSFRSRLLPNIISQQQECFTVYSAVTDQDGNVIPIGTEKKVDGFSVLRLAGRDAVSQVELLNLLPVQLINSDGYLLLEAGPAYRRKYLDWGVFHVEQSFISHWRKMKHILQQRNALLKARTVEQIQLWNEKFTEVGFLLHTMREKYITELHSIFTDLIAQLLPDLAVDIIYEAGWNVNYKLTEILDRNLNRDLIFGYTSNGPHRADLKFTVDGKSAFEVLSRGQQKMLIFALLLAQGLLLHEQTKKQCLYLIDDLPSELDSWRISNIAKVLAKMEAQTFVTAIEPKELLASFSEKYKPKLFHVKHGQIT